MATAAASVITTGELDIKKAPTADTDDIKEAPAAGDINIKRTSSKCKCKRHYIVGAIVGGLLVAISIYILRHGSKKHTPVVGCHTKDGRNISSMHDSHHQKPFIPLTPIGLNLTSTSNVSLHIRSYDNSSVLYLNLLYTSHLSTTSWVIQGNTDGSHSNWLQSVMFNYTVEPVGDILRLNFFLNGMLLKVHLTEYQGPTHTLTFWSEQFQPQGLFLEAECADETEYYHVFWGCYSVKSNHEKLNKLCLMGPLECVSVYVIILVASFLLVITLLAVYQKIDPQPLMSETKYSRV